MRVEHQVGAFVQTQRHAVRLVVHNGSGLPEKKVAVGIEHFRLNPDFHSAEAAARVFLHAARRLVAVDQNVGVMHQALVARTDLDRPHPSRLVDRDRQNEIPVLIDAARRQHVRLLRLHDQVGLSQLPAFDELRLGRKIRRLAFQHALRRPTL